METAILSSGFYSIARGTKADKTFLTRVRERKACTDCYHRDENRQHISVDNFYSP